MSVDVMDIQDKLSPIHTKFNPPRAVLILKIENKHSHHKYNICYCLIVRKKVDIFQGARLPITVQEIINLPMDEFNDLLSKHELSEDQLTLCRDIRRRGKNKVGVNCAPK